MFTELKFDPELLKVATAEKINNLEKNRGTRDLLGFGAQVIADRLKKNPLRYRDYGPYWWALKDVLNRVGMTLGDQSDPLVAYEYRGFSDTETLVAAEMFRDAYIKTSIVGTNRFNLDASGEWYTLYDPDMELPDF